MDTLTQTKQKTITGAEAIVKSFLAEGVDLAFGYPGGAIMPLYDAMYDYQDEFKHVLVRHEQGATHAAQGYARATGKTGVAIATSGPGATNLITGLADAQIDSTPMVCVTGQVHSHLLGTDAFQETDVMGISMPITKWNYQVTDAKEIPEVLAKAFYIAKSGRPGPVLIDITKDAQFGTLEFDYTPCTKISSYFPVPKTNVDQLKEAASAINAAKKPMILLGQGVLLADATEEFRLVAEKSGVPVASTLLGLSAMSTDHPNYVGMVGMHGNYAPNVLTNDCDLLIAVGMRFDDRVTGDLSRYAKQAKVVHFEIDPAELNKNVFADYPVLGNAKETLAQVLPFLTKRTHPTWFAKFKSLDDKEVAQVKTPVLFPTSEELSMAEVVKCISNTSDDAILVTDVGQHQMIATRYFDFGSKRTNITSGGLGTMGFALPAAIGAKLGAPHKQVVAVMGDGGFQMTLQELGTIMQTGAQVKMVILNNSFLGMVRQWQQMFFEERYASTEMTNPNFQGIAAAYNVATTKVTERSNLEQAVKEMLDHDGSYLMEVVVEKKECVFPMVPTGASVCEVRLS